MAMADESENCGKLAVRPEQLGSMEDSRGAGVDSNKPEKALSKKSDVQEEEVTAGGIQESNGDRESMRAPDTTETCTAGSKNADLFENLGHQSESTEEWIAGSVEEKEAKITCGNRFIGHRKYKVLSFRENSIKGNEVTSGGTECVGLDWLDGLDSTHKGYFPQNGNSSQLNKSRNQFRLLAVKHSDGHAAFEQTQPMLPPLVPGIVSHDNGGIVNQQSDGFPGVEVVSPIEKGLHENNGDEESKRAPDTAGIENVDPLENLGCQSETTEKRVGGSVEEKEKTEEFCGDEESMTVSDTRDAGPAENVDQFEKPDCQLESTGEHDQSQTDDGGLFEEKEVVGDVVFKAKITRGNRFIGHRKYKVLSSHGNSIEGNEVTSGGTECVRNPFRLVPVKHSEGHASFEGTKPMLPPKVPGIVSHDNGGTVNQQRDGFPGVEVVSRIEKGLHENNGDEESKRAPDTAGSENVDPFENLDCQSESTKECIAGSVEEKEEIGDLSGIQEEEVTIGGFQKGIGDGVINVVLESEIPRGNRFEAHMNYNKESLSKNSVEGIGVTGGDAKYVGLDGLDCLDSTHKGYFPQPNKSRRPFQFLVVTHSDGHAALEETKSMLLPVGLGVVSEGTGGIVNPQRDGFPGVEVGLGDVSNETSGPPLLKTEQRDGKGDLHGDPIFGENDSKHDIKDGLPTGAVEENSVVSKAKNCEDGLQLDPNTVETREPSGDSTANLPAKDSTVSENARERESPVTVGDGSDSSEDGNASFNVCCGVWDWVRRVRG